MNTNIRIPVGNYTIDTKPSTNTGNVYVYTRDFVLAGNLVVLGTNTTILATDTINLLKSTSTPSASTGNVVITSNTAGVGQSGVYTNPGSGAAPAELASTVSARKYALIFG
jgi:hypothetical protein